MEDQSAMYLELNVEPENGSVYVHSKHLPGLHLMGKSFQSMKPMLENAIKRLYRDNHAMNVRVVWLKDSFSSTAAICNASERVAVIPENAAAA
jgi:hypothetical protein